MSKTGYMSVELTIEMADRFADMLQFESSFEDHHLISLLRVAISRERIKLASCLEKELDLMLR